MDFGNFKDFGFLTFFIVMIVIALSLILLLLVLIASIVGKKNFVEQISYESTSAYIYIINAKQNTMVYFNKSDMRKKITADLLSFYSKFHSNDSEKVKNWIFSIMTDPKNADQYIEADILLNNGKKPCFSLLKLLKYEPEVGLIHIESRILKYYVPNNAPKAKKEKRVPTGIVKRSQIMNLVNHNKSLRGYTYCLRFFYAKQKVLSNNKIERHMIMTLKNVIYPFANLSKTSRQILDEGGSELFLFDLRISSKDSAMQLASSLAHALRKEMEVNGFTTYISFVIGIVENGQFYQDFDSIINFSREACISGQTNGNEIVLYQHNIDAQNEMIKFTEQIEHILKDDVLRFFFRPILDAKSGKTLGYFEYVRAYDSPFSNFQEMSKYAAKINKNIDLFANVVKHVIPKFVSECHEQKASLFLSVSMVDINQIVEIVKGVPTSSKARIIFVLEEQEVNENASDLDLLISALKKLKIEGFEIALLLNDKNLLLDDGVYHLFDFFVVGSAMLAAIRKNNHIRLSTYTLIEALLKYSKPIIATDLENWQSVELIIKSGIYLISSEVVAPSSDMLLPLEKKKLEKVVQLADKYS